jgi:hypothetical protein
MTLEVNSVILTGQILLFIAGFISYQIIKHRNGEKFFLYYGTGVVFVLIVTGILVILAESEVIKFV